MRTLLASLAAVLLLGGGAAAQEADSDPAAPAAPSFRTSATPSPAAPARFVPTPVPAPKDGAPLYGKSGYQPATGGMAGIAGYLILLLGLFAGGLWVLRNGLPKFRPGMKSARKLNIEETRSLGGRQFLVVAEYEGQKMLLGVCPGRIDRLCLLLSGKPPAEFPRIGPEDSE